MYAGRSTPRIEYFLYSTRPKSSTFVTRAVEDSAVVRQFPCVVQDNVNNLLADGVVSAWEMSAASSFPEVSCSGCSGCQRDCAHPSTTVVSRSTKTARGTCSPCTCFREESVERVVSSIDSLVTWRLTVRLNATSETRRGHPTLRQVLRRNGESPSVFKQTGRGVKCTLKFLRALPCPCFTRWSPWWRNRESSISRSGRRTTCHNASSHPRFSACA